jgi:putative tryptophan/tyrosine transport system substrate-binding protein
MKGASMRRREFVKLLGGAAATSSSLLPLAARAQQAAMPVIGLLSPVSPGPVASRLVAFRQGLNETGYIEGRNVTIEYRWAEEQYDRLPALAADLVGRHVTVVFAYGDLAARAAMAATTTIPIVFTSAGDPVRAGIVPSLNRPGGNATGATQFSADLMPKQLSLLHELIPNAATIALLIDENFPDAASQVSEVHKAARTLGLQVEVFNARTAGDIDMSFATLVRERAGALIVSGGAFLLGRREQIIALAARHAIPAMYAFRDFTAEGGLISYGNSGTDTFRRAGLYTGRILKGDKPADLPVDRATKFELIINLKTAKTLGIEVPLPLLISVDETIE